MSKSQADSEATAKVYQLDALDDKLKNIGKQLETVVNQTTGLATVAQLESAKQLLKEYTDEAVKDVRTEVRPTLKLNKALWGIIGTLTVLIIGQAILISILRS